MVRLRFALSIVLPTMGKFPAIIDWAYIGVCLKNARNVPQMPPAIYEPHSLVTSQFVGKKAGTYREYIDGSLIRSFNKNEDGSITPVFDEMTD